MPLVVLSGQPASGKSTVAAALRALFDESSTHVNIVDEPSLHLTRAAAYATGAAEKNTRASLKSTVERLASKQAVTILDSINNIKGYRYELWCIARAAGTRYCVVHVDTPAETCRAWNDSRPESDRYPATVFDDLVRRFETPEAKNRWDSPLFRVTPAGAEDMSETLQSVVAAMTAAPAANPSANSSRDLQPTVATSNAALLGTNTLHEIESAAQDVVSRISEAQAAAGCLAPGPVAVGDGLALLDVCQDITLADLRRLKRSFMKLATKITFSRLQSADAARRLFVDYLREQLNAGLQ